MAKSPFENMGNQILNSVEDAIRSGNFSTLSQDIGAAVSDTFEDIKNDIHLNVGYGRPSYQPKQRSTAKQLFDAPYGLSNHMHELSENLYNRLPGKWNGILSTLGGFAGFIVFGILSLSGLIVQARTGSFLVPLIVFLCLTLVGLIFGLSGAKKLSFINTYTRYIKEIDNQSFTPLRALSSKSGRSLPNVIKDLNKMIRAGLFHEGHVDEQSQYFILTDKDYQDLVNLRQEEILHQQQAARQKEALSPQVEKIIREGQAHLQHIKSCNEAIADPDITAKLNQMELLLARIFETVKEHPENASDLNQMIRFYLPTTAKLLDSYRDLDAQPIEVDNITNTKKEIAASLDSLNIAFEKLLDGLFADQAMDISTDISVLKTRLAQEGLSDGGFARMKE